MNTAQLVYDISSSYDAFGRLRMSDAYTIFDSKLLYNQQPFLWDEQAISGNGTSSYHSSNEAGVIMSVSSNVAGTLVRQTYQRFAYQPGKSQLVMMTGVLGSYSNGIIRRIGCFDSNNGLYFQSGPDDYYIVKRSYVTGTVVEDAVPQSKWNKNTLDTDDIISFQPNNANIYYFNYEWLGVGDICCGVVIGKKFIQLHQFFHANEKTTVSFSKPNLPLRYEIQNTGTGEAASLKCICSTVMSEGGHQNVGYIYTIDRGGTTVSVNSSGVLVPAITFRLIKGRESTNVFLEGVNIISTTTNVIFRWAVLLNPTFSTSITYTPVTSHSSVEYNNTTTSPTTVTEGLLIYSGYGIGTNATILTSTLAAKFSLGVSINGVSDVMCLAIQRLDNQNDNFYASVSIRENS